MLAGKDADLGGGRSGVVDKDVIGRHTHFLQLLEQETAVTIPAGYADEYRRSAKRRDIRRRVCRGARQCDCLVVTKNKDRSLSRNSRDRSVKELISHEIANDNDAFTREIYLDPCLKVVH